MNILKIKDPQGNWVDIPALKGDKGDKGDPGISPTIDSTLSQANQAADAKAVGDKINEITLTVDETLTQSGQVADAKVTGDALNTKADQNGYYENLNVGVADQLASKNYIEDNEAYTFRPTANGAKVGTREFDTIVGGSIVWNQLITDAANNLIVTQATKTVNSGEVTITSTNDSAAAKGAVNGKLCKVGKVYLIGAYFKTDDTSYAAVGFRVEGGTSASAGNNSMMWTNNTSYTYMGRIVKPSEFVNAGIYVRNDTPSGGSATFKNVQIFDLTQMFGSEIADHIYELEQAEVGAGVAWFHKYFPDEHYDYNPGELMHVSDLQSHDTVGFNLWDENDSGYLVGGSTYRAIDIPIGNSNLLNMTFVDKNPTVTLPTNISIGFVRSDYFKGTLIDKDYRWVILNGNQRPWKSNLSGGAGIPTSTSKLLGKVIIFPSSLETLALIKSKFDICINLSGVRNGEYQPHKKHSYPLDSSLTLRGIPKLTDGLLSFDGDIYKPDGTVERRYGVVDLGTLNWSYNSSVACFYVKVGSSQTKYSYSGICYADYKYTISPASSDKIWSNTGYMGAGWNLFFKDSAYTDAASFKAAMSGVYLVYELETPITEQSTPYQSPQIIDPYGTEEYVTTSIVPVGHQTQYPEDLRAKIESLPWDFTNLIAPVEITYIATRNYTAGSLFIVDNTLYKATTNIANGGTITPNTNCTATTLAEIIAAL